jgi:hypothetical protein
MVKQFIGDKGFIVNDYCLTTLLGNYNPKKKNDNSNYRCDVNNFFPSKSDIDSLPIHVLIIIHHQAIAAATIRANIRASLVPFVNVFHLSTLVLKDLI